MVDVAAQLITELKSLRKGRGIDDTDLRHRLGPVLCSLLDVVPGGPDDTAAVRAWLSHQADQLQPDLRLALLAAFGLHPDARHRFYGERVKWLAAQLCRDERTAQRRVDEASEHVAEIAASTARRRTITADTPWHTADLTTLVVLDGPTPEVVEWRRVVSHIDGLELVDLAVTVAGEPTGLGVDILCGGSLVRTVTESSRRVGLAVAPPVPLAEGQAADLALRFRVPELPHYVCVPRHRTDRFDLRVRFADRTPRHVVRLCGAFQSDVDDPAGPGEPVTPDAAGELRTTFDDLRPGFAYGVRWAGRPGVVQSTSNCSHLLD
ncbi:MAG TPA: hypothetical protein VHF06_09800 [Pseudonocardiaceae bacterium]|jgi:hypothetical protein|nr:hypothetical protein [Pseudonocardiaceae bacterium]